MHQQRASNSLSRLRRTFATTSRARLRSPNADGRVQSILVEAAIIAALACVTGGRGRIALIETPARLLLTMH
jgi:hypothetical protein